MQEDKERAREIKKRYDQKINTLEREIAHLRQNLQNELRALRRYKPIGLVA